MSQPSEEFAFEQIDDDTLDLSYRCLSFTIYSDHGEFTESDIHFWRGIIETLNAHFKEAAL